MMFSIAGSTERAWIAGARGVTFVPGAQSSSRAKPSASLRRRTCLAISVADQIAESRTYEG